jgi:hypothetical protein
MRAWGHEIARTAVGFGVAIVLAGAVPAAQEPQEVQPTPAPRAVRPVSPSGVFSGQAQTAPPAQRANWDQLGLRGFSVALVVGDLTGASTADNLPAGAKKALSDMRDFLPYKSYRLLDTHWILCCSGTRGDASVSGRLRGAEDEEYVFYINVRSGYESLDLGVTFTLRDTSTTYADHAATSVVTQRDREQRAVELAREREEAEKRASQGSQADQAAARAQYEDLRRQIAELERASQQTHVTSRASGARHVLDSTFSMKVGETVVIGTSRLKGDKALIALLTAAPRTGAASPRESR